MRRPRLRLRPVGITLCLFLACCCFIWAVFEDARVAPAGVIFAFWALLGLLAEVDDA